MLEIMLKTSPIFRDAFSPSANAPQRVNLGNHIERHKMAVDKFIRSTNRVNLASKQHKKKVKRAAEIKAYTDRENMQPITRFVVRDNDGNSFAKEVKVKRRFNPTRDEIRARKQKIMAGVA